MAAEGRNADIAAIERPVPPLMTYYALRSLLGGPIFPFLLLPAWFRYRTLRYRFDDAGISMSWGILFRREIHLTYSRIQDIHLVSNVVERWLGLARIQIQTAAGSAKAEMTIEGIASFETLRDFIYARMRGHRDPAAAGRPDDLAAVLLEVAAELRALREAMESRRA
jgi:putative membrane protein